MFMFYALKGFYVVGFITPKSFDIQNNFVFLQKVRLWINKDNT